MSLKCTQWEIIKWFAASFSLIICTLAIAAGNKYKNPDSFKIETDCAILSSFVTSLEEYAALFTTDDNQSPYRKLQKLSKDPKTASQTLTEFTADISKQAESFQKYVKEVKEQSTKDYSNVSIKPWFRKKLYTIYSQDIDPLKSDLPKVVQIPFTDSELLELMAFTDPIHDTTIDTFGRFQAALWGAYTWQQYYYHGEFPSSKQANNEIYAFYFIIFSDMYASNSKEDKKALTKLFLRGAGFHHIESLNEDQNDSEEDPSSEETSKIHQFKEFNKNLLEMLRPLLKKDSSKDVAEDVAEDIRIKINKFKLAVIKIEGILFSFIKIDENKIKAISCSSMFELILDDSQLVDTIEKLNKSLRKPTDESLLTNLFNILKFW